MADVTDILCVFSGEIDPTNGTYTLDIPAHEIELGTLQPGETYRLAVLPAKNASESTDAEPDNQPTPATNGASTPVDEGEVLDLEIEDLGEKGDGIARVGPGYVVIVNDAALGERVEAEITEVRENLAFADVVNHYDRA